MRAIEVLLLIGPFVAAGAWIYLSTGDGPPRSVVFGAAAGLALLFAGLIYVAETEGLGRGQTYVPATMQDGHIVPGHAAGS
jgi:hypothetical protein